MIVYAYPSGAASIESLLGFMTMLASVIGVIMFLIGAVRLILSFTQTDGQESQKAIFMLATAIALLLMITIFFGGPVKKLIVEFQRLGHVISN